jgi:NADP-dependent 3-hydroxy acid dehydrogenase YdfG
MISQKYTTAALITGAAASARHRARAGAGGYAVILHAIIRARTPKGYTTITAAGGRASVVPADLADYEGARLHLQQRSRPADTAVNNAGEFEPDDMETPLQSPPPSL